MRTSEDSSDRSGPRCAAIDDQTTRSAQNAENVAARRLGVGRCPSDATSEQICAIRGEMQVLTPLPNLTNVAHVAEIHRKIFEAVFPAGLVTRSEITP